MDLVEWNFVMSGVQSMLRTQEFIGQPLKINFVRGLWDRGYKPTLAVLMICEWNEHQDLSDYVNGDITRTAVSFRKCGMPQENVARSKH